MSSKHQAILELDLLEGFCQLPVQIDFTFHAKIPATGPSWASGGEPEEPALVEIDSIDSTDENKPLPDWMLELVWEYVNECCLEQLLEIAGGDNE
jgi:hypothetical protein